ncbi:aldo/keto reductase [Streptomyces sp. SID3343]|uniref:aldo/keto reductase n=1 Tax=Streptomyces sp. SID3343 TaxID=2690260 RepID=UPI001369A839|nr:aldo/keto reductase [Streptomyces sp. SID3343]
MSDVPEVILNNDVRIPQLGFGVWQVPNEGAAAAVTSALESGYRLVDTAGAYGNEEGVGAAIAASGIARDELFVTTKLWNREQGHDRALRAFDASLERLGLDHVDLYLIHWPVPKADKYVETWRALGKLYAEGRVRAIGVSNFRPAHLTRLIEETGLVPALNQIELHPHLPQLASRAFHAEHAIVTEAWSPLAQGGELLRDATVVTIADRLERTPAQVVLRWHIQLGNVVIPKSVTPARIAQNIEVFDFVLDEDDLAALATLETGERTGPDPDTFNLGHDG